VDTKVGQDTKRGIGRAVRITTLIAVAAALIVAGCVQPPRESVATKWGMVRADSKAQARDLADLLLELRPRVAAILPDATTARTEIWLDAALRGSGFEGDSAWRRSRISERAHPDRRQQRRHRRGFPARARTGARAHGRQLGSVAGNHEGRPVRRDRLPARARRGAAARARCAISRRASPSASRSCRSPAPSRRSAGASALACS